MQRLAAKDAGEPDIPLPQLPQPPPSKGGGSSPRPTSRQQPAQQVAEDNRMAGSSGPLTTTIPRGPSGEGGLRDFRQPSEPAAVPSVPPRGGSILLEVARREYASDHPEE